jgi:flagellar biosynthesis protein FliQ
MLIDEQIRMRCIFIICHILFSFRCATLLVACVVDIFQTNNQIDHQCGTVFIAQLQVRLELEVLNDRGLYKNKVKAQGLHA